jgi:hypothetical protein
MDREFLIWAVAELGSRNFRDQIVMLCQLPPGEARDMAAVARFLVWSKEDPAAANRFANSLESGKLRVLVRLWMLGPWANRDPLQAMAGISEIVPELHADHAW